MAIPFIRGAGVVKPGIGASLNRGHPLAANLVGCWLMNEGAGTQCGSLINGSDNLIFQAANTVWVPGTNLGSIHPSSAVDGANNGLLLTSPSSPLKPTSACSMFVRFSTNGNGDLNNNPPVAAMYFKNTNTSPFVSYGIHRKAGDQTALYVLDDVGGTSNSTFVSSLIVQNGGPYTAGFTIGPTSGKVTQYFAGRVVGTPATRTGSFSYDATAEFVCMYAPFNAQITGIDLDVVYVWNRELSADEHLWLASAPYDFVNWEVPKNKRYFGVPFLPSAFLPYVDQQLPQLMPQ